jgi:hypothetical protein
VRTELAQSAGAVLLADAAPATWATTLSSSRNPPSLDASGRGPTVRQEGSHLPVLGSLHLCTRAAAHSDRQQLGSSECHKRVEQPLKPAPDERA